jgi:hypothetical protein
MKPVMVVRVMSLELEVVVVKALRRSKPIKTS